MAANFHQHEFAITCVLQFLEEAGLRETAECLRNETDHLYDTELVEKGGTLLAVLDAFQDNERSQLAIDSDDEKDKEIEKFLFNRKSQPFIRNLLLSSDQIHRANILTVRFVPSLSDDLIVATGSVDKSFKITNLTAGTEVFCCAAPFRSAILSIDFNPKYPYLVLCSCMDGTISLLNTELMDNPLVFQTPHHRKYVVSVKWHPEGVLFAAAAYDHSFTLWRSGRNSHSGLPIDWALAKEHLFCGTVETFEFVKCTNVIAVAIRDDNYLHLIDSGTFEETNRINMNVNLDDHVSFTAMHMASSADGKYLVISTDKHRLILYVFGESKIVRNFYGAHNDEYSNPRLAWSHDEAFIYATSQDHSIVCWEVATQRQVTKLMGHTALVRDLHRHPTKNMLVSCGFDKSVKVWTSG